MYNEFKIGDLVTPTRTCESLCEGCAYTVQDVVVWVDHKLLAILSSQGHNILYDATGFKLYQPQEKTMSEIIDKSPEQHVKEFLKKLEYVLDKDSTVASSLGFTRHIHYGDPTLLLGSDISDIKGVDDIYTYINNSYDQLTSQAAQKRKLELLDKKAKLDVELAEINKELEGL